MYHEALIHPVPEIESGVASFFSNVPVPSGSNVKTDVTFFTGDVKDDFGSNLVPKMETLGKIRPDHGQYDLESHDGFCHKKVSCLSAFHK